MHSGEKRSLASASNNLKNDIDSIFAEDKKDEKRESLLKPLYRKIMLMAHPDKLVNIEDPHLKEVYSEVCRKAMNAMEDLNWYKLYDSAIEIGIKDFDIKIQHINLIKEDQALIEKEISEIKKTIPWLWFHSENHIKNKYLKYFLKNHA